MNIVMMGVLTNGKLCAWSKIQTYPFCHSGATILTINLSRLRDAITLSLFIYKVISPTADHYRILGVFLKVVNILNPHFLPFQ